MCGITGYISVNKYDEKKILDLLAHRGPDGRDSFSDFLFNKNIFLGHTRLKIIDLSPAGSQPMYSADKKIVLIFNGEIYNYKDLKSEYLSDVRFNSKTDTEVILKLYERFGISCIEKLNGDFAIAILDKNLNKLFLIRDRLGVKPLYYYMTETQLIFASELKPILSAISKPEISEENLENYFVFKYVPGNETLVKGIKRLQPGSFLEYDLGGGNHETKHFWNLKLNEDYRNMSYTDAKNTLEELLNKSITSQLIADVPVGVFFSGGVDSSIIASSTLHHPEIAYYTARKSQQDIIKEGTISDYYYANKLAKDLKLNLELVDIGGAQLNLELIRKTIFYSDDLIADGSQIPSFLITQEAAKTSTVLLSGMGADELFYGYAGHQISLLSTYLENAPGILINPLMKSFRELKPGIGSFKAYKRYLKKLGQYYEYDNLKYGLMNIVGDYRNSLSVINNNPGSARDYILNYFNSGSSLFDSITRFEIENFLVKNLHYLDRMCMANSVEGRVPYLDYRLVEFAYSLPRNYKLSGFGKGKKILKETYSGKLPSYIFKRRKAGFGMPLRSIFSSQSKIKELLDEDYFQSSKNFSIENIRRIINNHLKGTEDNSSIIYALISFQEWYKMFIKS